MMLPPLAVARATARGYRADLDKISGVGARRLVVLLKEIERLEAGVRLIAGATTCAASKDALLTLLKGSP